MEMQRVEAVEQDGRVYTPICWCGIGPIGTTGTIFFGAILAISGGIWFLFNLGLITPAILDLIWPLVLMGVGLSYLGWAVYTRIQGR